MSWFVWRGMEQPSRKSILRQMWVSGRSRDTAGVSQPDDYLPSDELEVFVFARTWCSPASKSAACTPRATAECLTGKNTHRILVWVGWGSISVHVFVIILCIARKHGFGPPSYRRLVAVLAPNPRHKA